MTYKQTIIMPPLVPPPTKSSKGSIAGPYLATVWNNNCLYIFSMYGLQEGDEVVWTLDATDLNFHTAFDMHALLVGVDPGGQISVTATVNGITYGPLEVDSTGCGV